MANHQHDCGNIRIQYDPTLLDTREAARHLGVPVAQLRKTAKGLGDRLPGARIKVNGKAVDFVSMKHPDPDCFMPGPFWRAVAQEVG